MSRIAKLLLVLTSLAPAIGALALVEAQKGNWGLAASLIVAALLLVFICWGVKKYPEQKGERITLRITAVESGDKETLAFIIAYLLPILTGEFPDLTEPQYWTMTAYVFLIIGLTIYHSNAFHFNPVLAIFFGYHFYEVTADEGMKYLLITRQCFKKQACDVTATKLSEYVYLEVPAKKSSKKPSKKESLENDD